jgi:hypothetical protein
MAVSFKVVPSARYYTYDETYKVWTDRQSDKEYMKKLVDEGETLSVVGVVQEAGDAIASSLSSGIYYPASLVKHLMDLSAQEQVVLDQLAADDINVFTGKTFEEEQESAGADAFGFDELMTVDQDAITNAFGVDSSKLNVDISGALDPNALAASMPPMPALDMNDFVSQLDIEIPAEALNAIASDVLQEYLVYCFTNGILTPDEIMAGLPDYLTRPEVQAQIAAKLGESVDTQGLQDEFQASLNAYMQQVMGSYMATVMQGMQTQIQGALNGAMQQLSTNMASAMTFNQDAFQEAFQFNLSEEELSQVIMTMMSGESNTYNSNLRKLGYATLDKPSGISIYPIDFENKQQVLEILDTYNTQMKDEGAEDKVITYTDIVGVLMSSVTTIVDMISTVLVAFVAISLVVSSIMIGVITYISVLERKKEIGILRAMGARKRDIGNVFNAETMIVGLIAGLLGISVTLLLTIPANIIVYAAVGVQNIALLPAIPAAGLVLVSVALTFVAGLIPSSAASRRDPVEALRSE